MLEQGVDMEQYNLHEGRFKLTRRIDAPDAGSWPGADVA